MNTTTNKTVAWAELKKLLEDPYKIPKFEFLAEHIEKVCGSRKDCVELITEFIETCAIIDYFQQIPTYLKRRMRGFWRTFQEYERFVKRLAKLIKIFEVVDENKDLIVVEFVNEKDLIVVEVVYDPRDGNIYIIY